MNKRLLLVASLLITFALVARAQTLATYSESNISGTFVTPSGVNADTTASNETLGAGIVDENDFGFGGYSDKGDNGTPTPFPTAVDGLGGAKLDNSYFGFTVAPTTGNFLDITGVDFSSANVFSYGANNGVGTYTYTLRSSADNFTSNLGTFSFAADSTGYGPKITFSGAEATALAFDVAPVTFHLFVTYTEGSKNYVYAFLPYQGSFSVDGSAELIPEPATFALLGFGLAGLVVIARFRRALIS